MVQVEGVPNCAWVDIETTGLNPRQDAILEIGIVITSPGPEWRPLAEHEWILPLSDFNPAWNHIPDIVRTMHTNNGLLDLCEIAHREGIDDDISVELENFMKNNAAVGSAMYGSGPHFDRMFLKGAYPDFEALFHYRNYDVSTIRRFIDDVKGPQPWLHNDEHRALHDIHETIANLIHARNILES